MNNNEKGLEIQYLNLTEEEIIINFLQKKYDLLITKIEEFNNITRKNTLIDKDIKKNKYNNGNNENNIISLSKLIKKNILLFEMQIQGL